LEGVRSRFILEATIFNQKVVADFDAAGGRHKPCPNIAKRIEALASDDPWRQINLVLTLRRSFWREGCTDRSTTIGTS
jgi:hypothetical protein